MAQEQEYKYSNVCVPPTPRVRKAEQQQNKDAQLLLKGVCLSRPACLAAFPALPVPNRGVLQNFLPPTQTGGASVTIHSPGLFLEGKESEKTGRKGKVIKGPHQASLGRALQEGVRQHPHPPAPALLAGQRAPRRALAEGSTREPPRRAQR